MPIITIKGTEIDFRPMTREKAALWQKVCTELGLHTYCPFRACRRHRRCATRQVLCDQIMRQEVNAIVLPAVEARLAGQSANAGAAATEDRAQAATEARRKPRR